MNVLHRDLKHGLVKLVVESTDDLWYLTQVLRSGDVVKAKTTRRVKSKDQREGSDERKTFTLGVKIEQVDFKSDAETLRVLGTIVEGPEEFISYGSHHSLSIESGSRISIVKEKWLKNELSRLDEAVKSTHQSSVLIVALDEGDASFGLVKQSKLKFYDFSSQIGGKYDTSSREKNKAGFYKQTSEFITNLMEKENAGALVLAGPGFEKDNFLAYLSEKNPGLAKKAVLESTGNAGHAGVKEAIKRPEMKTVLKNLGAAEDINLVNKLLEHIGRDDGLSVYGLDEITTAVNLGAVETLLVLDQTFIEERTELEPMMQSVKQAKGQVHIVNQDSEAGKQLKALGGIAGLLRFKIQ